MGDLQALSLAMLDILGVYYYMDSVDWNAEMEWWNGLEWNGMERFGLSLRTVVGVSNH